jgi:hypothetical protein
MLGDDDELSAALPSHGEVEDDWDEVADKLSTRNSTWLDNFTRLVFGRDTAALEPVIDIDATTCHPFCWWEPNSSTAGFSFDPGRACRT